MPIFFIEPDDHELRSSLADELGEDNNYHITHGFYGDFVGLRLADASRKSTLFLP